MNETNTMFSGIEKSAKDTHITHKKIIHELINFDKEPENPVKVSVVVPVYNVEQYLRECLDSCINQTLKEIEVICVDDRSTDDSLKILKEYAETDDRIKVIALAENSTASIARKIGVQTITGDYVLFMDADDTLELNACKFLYDNMIKNPVDILHFGTNVINCANLPKTRIDNMQKFVKPFNGKIVGKAVFESCFINQKYQFSLWNKLYRSDLVKKAFFYVEDLPLPKAQDKYAYYIISYFAESYRGIENKFYNYKFGNGITGHNVLDLPAFERYCKMGLTADSIIRFSHSMNDPVCTSAAEKSLYQLLNDCVSNWGRLSDADTAEGFDLILDYFDKADVISAIAKKDWWNFGIIARKIFGSQKLNVENKEIKTIATYYFKLECGGAQRVLVELAKIWVNMGYNVIVLTDTEPCEGDYDLPENVTRITLPSFFTITKENYINRAKTIQKITEEYNIDLVVYHAWLSNLILWDLAMFKLNNIKFSIHCHNIFSVLPIKSGLSWSKMPYIYSLADGIITLTDVDKQYWSNFNDNVIQVTNPLSFGDVQSCNPSRLSNHNILWCARFSDEKRPLDAIEIFNIVHREVPTAKLFMLGKGTKPDFYDEIKKRISKYKIEEDVILCGYQKDPQTFYELSSVYLMTSEYEGFSLTLYESMVFGVPTVMYELPYLSWIESGKGIVPIKDQSILKAANAVIELLQNDSKRKQLGKEARELAEQTAQFNYKAAWKSFFDKTSDVSNSKKKIPTLWDTLFSHYRAGVIKKNNQISDLEKKTDELKSKIKFLENRPKGIDIAQHDIILQQLDSAKHEIEAIRSSLSFKVGRFVTWFPRKIKELFKRNKRNQ